MYTLCTHISSFVMTDIVYLRTSVLLISPLIVCTNWPLVVSSVKEAKSAASSDMKKMTRLGMEASKDENLSEWYSQVIVVFY